MDHDLLIPAGLSEEAHLFLEHDVGGEFVGHRAPLCRIAFIAFSASFPNFDEPQPYPVIPAKAGIQSSV